MEEEKEVKLHGLWASPFCTRVEMALKLKGVAYEYVEEDLSNKSECLLQHNPVHKLVPVMLHQGRPISESLIILQYIDETWNSPDLPSLLPQHPYFKARVLFWSHFYEQKLVPSTREILRYTGNEQSKAIAEFEENLKVLEEGIEKEFLGGTGGKKQRFVNGGESPGFLELLVAATSCWFKVLDEMFGLRLVSRERHPVVSSWLDACHDHEVVRSTMPDHQMLLAYAVRVRERLLGLASS
ncbi:hypothetical protein ACLOJK_029074 [Asimina triloba]